MQLLAVYVWHSSQYSYDYSYVFFLSAQYVWVVFIRTIYFENVQQTRCIIGMLHALTSVTQIHPLYYNSIAREIILNFGSVQSTVCVCALAVYMEIYLSEFTMTVDRNVNFVCTDYVSRIVIVFEYANTCRWSRWG